MISFEFNLVCIFVHVTIKIYTKHIIIFIYLLNFNVFLHKIN